LPKYAQLFFTQTQFKTYMYLHVQVLMSLKINIEILVKQNFDLPYDKTSCHCFIQKETNHTISSMKSFYGSSKTGKELQERGQSQQERKE
jgi:hypothetical protein